MSKKNIVISGYFVKNIGDDLMLISFLNKYREKYDKIYINSNKICKKYYEEMGVTVKTYDTFFHKILKLIFAILKIPDFFYRLANKSNTDFLILGGSVFMETSRFYSRYQLNNLKFAVNTAENSYVIGSNFGPYKTEKFLKEYRKLFEKCKDVCFRDKYSYDLFYELPSVRYAPDIVMSGLWNKIDEDKIRTNNVIISVINLEGRPVLNDKLTEYENMIANICDYHVLNGDNVILMSFCDRENDLEACNRIKNKSKYEQNVVVLNYEDLSILNFLSSSKKIYGTRFHAVILAIYYNIPCIPFIYSDKTLNALCAYSKDFYSVDIRKLEQYNIKEIVNMNEQIKVTDDIKISAKKQLDGINSNVINENN